MPTEGDPAIVGSWCLLREVSDCFCIELAVWEVARDVMELLGVSEVVGSVELGEDFRPATRLAVVGGIAVTCIGGRLTGLAFLGSVDDKVYKTVRLILVNIRNYQPFHVSSP